jgi:hypothetical protein
MPYRTAVEGGSLLGTRIFVLLFSTTVILTMALPPSVAGQEAMLEVLPIRPLNFDISFNQRTFAPEARNIAGQVGITALRYGPLEVRSVYQYFSMRTSTFVTDQHSLFLNPRWNNFIDLLDFPKAKPLNRVIRHVLFGPLEHRAVPYIGALIGGTLPGRDADSLGYLYGGQVGVRFPVARGFSIDMGLQYSRFQIDFQGVSDVSEQWLLTIGIRM